MRVEGVPAANVESMVPIIKRAAVKRSGAGDSGHRGAGSCGGRRDGNRMRAMLRIFSKDKFHTYPAPIHVDEIRLDAAFRFVAVVDRYADSGAPS